MAKYQHANLDLWQGRIDSEDQYDSFRWHQIIERLDLDNDIDIASSDLCFVFIGYQIDEGVRINKGRIGAADGPDKVRELLCNRPCSFSRQVHLYDGGNVQLDTSVEAAQQYLSKLVKKCLDKNYFPIVIGGGHDVAYGTLSGVLAHSIPIEKSVASINFDAHFDMRDAKQSTSGTMFRQVYTDLSSRNLAFNHMTVGVQKSNNTMSLFKFASQIESPYILAGDFSHDRRADLYKTIHQFIAPSNHVYLTVCTDVFASPYAPGVSSPTPLGISPELFLVVLKDILSTNKVVAFDIAEIAPSLDTSNTTAMLGSLIIYTIINHLSDINDVTSYI